MISGEASRTSMLTALSRAAHLEFDSAPYLIEDRFAFDLVDPEFQPFIEAFKGLGDVHQDVKDLRYYVPFRARYAEDCLKSACEAGAQQYLILGAGLDSYALRQDPDMSHLAIVEIDHPDTQNAKLERMRTLGLTPPSNTVYKPCDFEKTPLGDALFEAGFSNATKSFCAWMGVTMYISKEAVQETLETVSGMMAPGSEILIEYLPVDEELDEAGRRVRDFVASYTADLGEPIDNLYTVTEMSDVLAQSGFSQVLPVSMAKAEETYFSMRRDGVRLVSNFRLIRAIK